MSEHEDVSFKDALNLLFEWCTHDDGTPFSNREVAHVINAAGGSISHAYISLLKNGGSDDPRKSHIKALAQFFGVPAGYFLDANVNARWKAHFRGEREPELPAPRGPQTVLLRSISGMSSRSQSLFRALAEHVNELEAEEDDTLTDD